MDIFADGYVSKYMRELHNTVTYYYVGLVYLFNHESDIHSFVGTLVAVRTFVL